jgi:hypothetical protein
MKKYLIISLLLLTSLFISCKVQTEKSKLTSFPVNDLNGVITQTGIQFDKNISSDGNGSIRIDAAGPIAVQLYIIDDVKVEDTQVIYEAKIKSDGLSGQAYLEMWCVFKDQGEFFSRGFDSVISGSTDWKTIRTVFNLKKGETPDQFKLNIVVNGAGTIWIDDIRLSKT